jgi:hypothetical protein
LFSEQKVRLACSVFYQDRFFGVNNTACNACCNGELRDDIGSRVTGTPAERKAEEWGAAKMKAIGLENVHLEKYTIWKGWTRGTADAQLLSPTAHKLHVDAMGWTGSTVAGGAEGDVVPVNMFDIDEK